MKPFSLLATAILLVASHESTNLYSSEIDEQNTQRETTQEAAVVEIAQTTTDQVNHQIQKEESNSKELIFVKAAYQSDSDDLGDDQGYWIWVDKDSGTATKATGKNPGKGQNTKKVSDTSSSSKQNNKQMQMDTNMSTDTQTAWMIAADFLWWSANFNTISAVDADIVTGNNVQANIHLKRPYTTWDPGVRLTAGYVPGYDHWDAQAAWTFFYNSTESSNIPLKVDVTDPSKSGGNVISTILGSITNLSSSPFQAAAATATTQDVGFTGGGSKFSFGYNAADLDVGKSYFISRSFFVRPYTGIHAIWTDMDAHYSLTSGGNVFNSGGGEVDVHVHIDIDTWGIGPMLGFNTNWGQFKGFSLIGNIAGSLVYGQISDKTTVNLLIAPQTIDITFKDSRYWQLMPTLQIQFGLSYCLYFGQSDNQFRVNAMWESNFLWETGNILVFDKSISMQGLTLSFGFMF